MIIIFTMANESPLYEDSEIRIEVMHSNPEAQIIYFVNEKFGEAVHYVIPRGILEEFATTPRDGIESKMMNFDEHMVHDARNRGLTIDSLHISIAQAYIEEEKRYQYSR